MTAAFAARRPSVKEPEENLWALPPTVSPAPKSPSTVNIRLYPQKYSDGEISSGPLTQAPEQVAWEPITYGSDILSSGLVCFGSMFWDAQTTACPTVIPRKFSHPTCSK